MDFVIEEDAGSGGYQDAAGCGSYSDRFGSVLQAHRPGVLEGSDRDSTYVVTHLAGVVSTECPYCGSETSFVRATQPRLAAIGLAEFETLVRNEWRGRLREEFGDEVYFRPHSRSLIRALIVFALKPESPVRSQVVDELLWRQVADLESWGMSREQMRLELLFLCRAIWEIMSNSGLEFDRSWTLMQRIDAKLHSALGWSGMRAPA